MRQKTQKLVITFPTTTAAMQAEKRCTERSLPGRLIPVPREITAGCGMAWCAPTDAREQLERFFSEEQMQCSGFYELML